MTVRLALAIAFALAVSACASGEDLTSLNAEGVEHYKAGRFAEAVDAFEKAAALAPGEATVRTNLGRSYQALGLERRKLRELSDAADSFRKAVDVQPEEMEPRVLHGETLAQMDRADDAVSALEEALRLIPPTARATRTLGFVQYRAGRRDEAIGRWRESLELDPKQADLRGWIERAEREAESERNFARSGSSIFTVSYDQRGGPDLARTVLDLLESAMRDVTGELGLFPTTNVEVVLLPDRTFREVNEVPGWVGGLYDGRIKFPAGNLRGDSEHLGRLARHELTHALLHQAVGRSPGWLEEGLAQLMEGGDGETANALVRSAAADGRLIPMEKLTGSFVSMADTEQVSLAYAQSLSFCRWLRERHGKYTVRLYLERLGGSDSSSAFQDAFGTGLAESAEEWTRGL